MDNSFKRFWQLGSGDEIAQRANVPVSVSELSNDADYMTNGRFDGFLSGGFSELSSAATEGVDARIEGLSGAFDGKIRDAVARIPADLGDLSNGAGYAKRSEILLGYDAGLKALSLSAGGSVTSVDCSGFVKDGMISEAKIVGDSLVIVFNADAGKEPVSIPLTQIFNPANYYDKTTTDNRFVQKEAGKGLVAVDATLTAQGAAADAKATGTALYTGFTEWVYTGGVSPDVVYSVQLESPISNIFIANLLANGNYVSYNYISGFDVTEIEFTNTLETSISATRHLVTPTKTSQLTNDSGFITQHQQLSACYAKSETSSAAEIGAGLEGVRSRLTGYADAAALYQYGRASAYTDQHVSSKADASALSDYLSMTSTAEQIVASPVGFTHPNGVYAERIDANRINFTYSEGDTCNSVQSDGVSSLLLIGNFNSASAHLPIKDGGTIAYVSDVEQAVSPLIYRIAQLESRVAELEISATALADGILS